VVVLDYFISDPELAPMDTLGSSVTIGSTYCSNLKKSP